MGKKNACRDAAGNPEPDQGPSDNPQQRTLNELRCELILLRAGYTQEETLTWSFPKFKFRALVARKRELELAAEQSLAVWDGQKFSKLLSDLDYDLDPFLDP